MQNFYVQVQGNVARRPGTQFMGLCKFNTGNTIVIPFQFSTDQQYIVEAGANYFRFIYAGAYLVNTDGTPYEIATPYAAADLPTLRFVQSNDVLTITHGSYQPMQLERLGALSWQLAAFSVGTLLPELFGLAAAANMGIGFGTATPPATKNYTYVVTACSDITKDEGPISGTAICTNYDLGYNEQYGVFNNITWTTVTAADFYKVYRLYQGVYAFVGTAVTGAFTDTGYLPDTSLTPPTGLNPFTGNNWPSCAAYFQERLFFAGSLQSPETIWASRSGNYTNFNVSTPVVDDDGITFTLAARQVNQIRHMVPHTDLVVFTGGGGWRLAGGNGPVAPANFDMAPQTFPGVSDLVSPLVVGNYMLFCEAKGSSVREVVFNLYANSYVSEDRSVLANHLFKGHRIVSWAYAESPNKVVWMVRDDGMLLSLTYLKEQEVYAFAQHPLGNGGVFLSVAVISETLYGVAEDVPYFVVQRYIQGAASTRIVRMHSEQLGYQSYIGQPIDVTQAWYVDEGLQYAGSPVTSVSGLSHLEGQAVAILADGVPLTGVVSSGTITLAVAASRITVGVPMTSTIVTLPPDNPQDPTFGEQKRINKVSISVNNTAGLTVQRFPTDTPIPFIGLATDDPADPSEAGYITNATIVSGIQEVVTEEGYDLLGQVTISTSGAQPAYINAIGLTLEPGS